MKSYDFYPIVKNVIYVIVIFIIVIDLAKCGSGPSLESLGEVPTEVVYITVDEISSDIDQNPIRAKEKYKGKWFRISGKLNIIDENGRYFYLQGFKCEIPKEKRSELRDILYESDEGDDIVVLGKITDVNSLGCDLAVVEVFNDRLEQIRSRYVIKYNGNMESIEERNKKIKSAFIKAYNDVVNSIDYTDPNDDPMFRFEYFMYDITGDGIPEFWIIYGNCEVAYMLKVCAYDKEGQYKTIWESGIGHSTLYEGNGYVLNVYGHMGHAAWSKLTYDGKKMVHPTNA